MPESLPWILIFLVSLAVLIKSSDFFTNAADLIGIYFGVPRFIIGVTIVAIGTSLPELVASIFAVTTGNSEIVVGNVIGSNITNICLIIGVSAIVGNGLSTTYDLINVDLPLFIGSAFLFAFMILDGEFTIGEALICIAGIVIYFLYAVGVEKEHKRHTLFGKSDDKENSEDKIKLGWKPPLALVVSSVFIFIGAKYTVESVVKLSEIFNIAKEIIAVTAVAIGTSLPELTVSVSAARSGKSELAIGNILGSNIFNSFAVMGIPALFGPVLVPEAILGFPLQVMLAVTILYVFTAQDKIISKWEGWLFILFYCFFFGRIIKVL